MLRSCRKRLVCCSLDAVGYQNPVTVGCNKTKGKWVGVMWANSALCDAQLPGTS